MSSLPGRLDAGPHRRLRVIGVFGDDRRAAASKSPLSNASTMLRWSWVMSPTTLDRRGQHLPHVLLHEEPPVGLGQDGIARGLDREQVERRVGIAEAGRVGEAPVLDVLAGGLRQPPVLGELLARELAQHQLGGPQLQRHPRVERLVGVDGLDVRLADLADHAATRELLVVEAGRLDALVGQVLAHRVDHGRRTAQVDVDNPVVEVLGLHVVGDVALVRIAALLRRHHAGDGDVGHPGGVALELVDLDQVGVVGHAEDQVDRVLTAAVLLDLVEHRQERREARAASQEEHRPLDLAQVEAAQRAVERDAVAGFARSRR